MKYVKRFSLIIFAVLILVAFVPVDAFAVDPVVFTEAETLGATIVDLYGVYNNTSLAYDSISSSGALTEIVTLYQDYSTSASDPYTLAIIGAAAAAAGAVAVIYDAVTGQGYVQLYQEQYISSLDGYWDYQLTDIGLVRDSITDLFSWTEVNNQVVPITVYSNSFAFIAGYAFQLLPCDYVIYDSLDGTYQDVKYSLSSSSPIYYICYDNNSSSVPYGIRLYSPSQGVSYVLARYGLSTHYSDTSNENLYNNSDGYSSRGAGISRSGNDIYTLPPNYVPSFDWSACQNALSSNNGQPSNYINNGILLEPSTYIGDPLQNPLEITLPNPLVPDYQPQPQRITTNIPWNPDWGNPLPDSVVTPEYGVPYPVSDPELLNIAVPEIWDSIVADGVEIQDSPEPVEPAPSPTEVFIPFLPVTLPNFNFSLSGIWHYVREWVSSLGAWLITMFSVWASLPYAMVVPVYATAVIVIVLGVYKRFFM